MSLLEFGAALDNARTLAVVDEVARGLWRAYGAGEIGEGDAGSLAARIEQARQRIRPKDSLSAPSPATPLAAVSLFPPRKRRCASPDRARSRERRRRLAYSGVMPPALAAGFTPGQLAALRIVADEVRAQGSCRLSLAEIAARAGVCVTTARDGIKLAACDGLLTVRERRRRGTRNLPNVVAIVSREWRAWLSHARWGGSKFANPMDRAFNKEAAQPSGTAATLATGRCQLRSGTTVGPVPAGPIGPPSPVPV